MKKLLLLTGLLAVFNLGFGTDEATSEVKVRANIIGRRLDVTTTEVVFTDIVRGVRDAAPTTMGTINIEGEANKIVKIQIADGTNGTMMNPDYSSNVTLVNETNQEKKINYRPEIIPNGSTNPYYGDGGLALNEDGKLTLNVSGALDASNAEVGSYTGAMGIKVIYAHWN